MKKIVVLGTPVAPGNRGVMALGASVVTLFEATLGEVEATFLLVHQPWDEVQIHGLHGRRTVNVITSRMAPSAGLKDHLGWILLLSALYRCVPILRGWVKNKSPWIRVVAESDVVGDIRGGDSFSDIYGIKRFLLAALPVLSVLLIRKRIVHLPQTYGPYKSRISRMLAKFLLRRSSLIIARDSDSQAIAQQLVGPAQRVLLSPDVAFMLKAVEPSEIQSEPKWADLNSGLRVGLNVNGLMYNGGYDRKNMFSLVLDYPSFLKTLVSKMLSEFACDIVLIPHTYAVDGNVESDNEAARKLFSSLSSEEQRRVWVVTGEYDQHEIKGVIGGCSFFIGSRMHACIAALSQGIPCVGVAYSQKFVGVFRSVGVDSWVVDSRVSGNQHAVSRIMELIRTRTEAAATLKIKVAEARSALLRVFRAIPDHEAKPAKY